MLFVDLMLIDKLKALSFSKKLLYLTSLCIKHRTGLVDIISGYVSGYLCHEKKGEEFIMRMPIGKADYQIYILYICIFLAYI